MEVLAFAKAKTSVESFFPEVRQPHEITPSGAEQPMASQRKFPLSSSAPLPSIEKSAGRRIVVVDEGETVHARIVTYHNTLGFRNVHVTLSLGSKNPVELTLDLDKDNAIALMDHIQSVNSFAWREGHPLDAEAHETRPSWVKQWPQRER